MRFTMSILAWLTSLSLAGCANKQPLAPTFPPTSGGCSVGYATYYAKKFEGRRTANGETYDPRKKTAAHRSLPFGTEILVQSSTGRSVVVRINDRGPFRGRAVLDLSHEAADELGILSSGNARIRFCRL